MGGRDLLSWGRAVTEQRHDNIGVVHVSCEGS